MTGFMDDQCLDAEFIKRRLRRVIECIQANISKGRPERPNVGAHALEADLCPAGAQEVCCHTTLLPQLDDSIQEVFHPKGVFHRSTFYHRKYKSITVDHEMAGRSPAFNFLKY